MKKIISLIVAVLTLGVISSNVFAAEMPVKKICDILNGTGIYVLSENGTLYSVDNFETPSKTKYYDDVIEIKALNPGRYFYNTLLLGLRENGEIFTFCYNGYVSSFSGIYSMEVNIKQLSQIIEVEPELDYVIYINNRNEIVHKNKNGAE